MAGRDPSPSPKSLLCNYSELCDFLKIVAVSLSTFLCCVCGIKFNISKFTTLTQSYSVRQPHALYFDGMLPPFAIQSEENIAMAKDCSIGIEPRISSERIILLDTQPVFDASVLAEMIRPDGSSTIPVIRGESLSAELAHELMDIQLAVFLASICHILLVVSEGVLDNSMWRLMSKVDLLKHDISDPSLLASSLSQSSSSGIEKDNKVPEGEYLATPVFIHTKLQGRELTPRIVWLLSKALMHDFKSSSFVRENTGNNPDEHSSSMVHDTHMDSNPLNLFAIPFNKKGTTQELNMRVTFLLYGNYGIRF